jgi:hypothetical protein
MSSRTLALSVLTLVIGVSVVAVIGLVLTPQATNPAFAAATRFIEAAGRGDEAAAFALLSETMQAYVKTNCPNGRVSACVQGYIPPEWGAFLSAVFRRAAPDGVNWQVEMIATYEKDKGFSGVCIHQRMESDSAGGWRVAGWAGFIACGDPRSRNMSTNPNTPNRAP